MDNLFDLRDPRSDRLADILLRAPKNNSHAVRIIVIEDHKLVREMLVLSFSSIISRAEARGAHSGETGVALCAEFQPNVLFLDLALPDGDGLDFVPRIFAAAPDTKVVALTSHTDQFTLHRALRSNVHGFVDKNEQPLSVLKEAIYTVLQGEQYFSSTALRLRVAMGKDPAAFNKILSEHEQQLLGYFGQGHTNAEVAKLAQLSAGTVRNHRCIIMSKLDIHSTPQLIRYAVEKGFARRMPQALTA